MDSKETHGFIHAALWSIRSDSPRLFFVSNEDLLDMLSKTLNDLPALQQFFDNVFPQLSAIILVEGTDLTVSKKVRSHSKVLNLKIFTVKSYLFFKKRDIIRKSKVSFQKMAKQLYLTKSSGQDLGLTTGSSVWDYI